MISLPTQVTIQNIFFCRYISLFVYTYFCFVLLRLINRHLYFFQFFPVILKPSVFPLLIFFFHLSFPFSPPILPHFLFFLPMRSVILYIIIHVVSLFLLLPLSLFLFIRYQRPFSIFPYCYSDLLPEILPKFISFRFQHDLF